MKAFLVFILLSSYVQANEILDIFERYPSQKKSLRLQKQFEVKDEMVESIEKNFKKLSKEQSSFFKSLRDQKFKEAFLKWDQSFSKSWFKKTNTAKALKAYVLLESGFYDLGLRSLFQIKNVSQINQNLKERIKLSLREDHFIWNKTYLPWNSSWSQVFSKKIKSHMFASPVYSGIKGKKLFQYIQRTLPGSKERSLLQWRLAVDYYEKGKLKKASEILSFLVQEKNSFVSKSLIYLTVARFLYEKSLLKEALIYYNKIDKSSVHWFVAQEEKVWTYIRMNETKKALEIASSINSESLKHLVSPEAIFLNSFLNLKVCNYLEAYRNSLIFKKRYSQKIPVLSRLIEKDKDYTDSYIEAKKTNKFKFSSADHHRFNHYPVESLKSLYLDDLVQKITYIENEFASFTKNFKNKLDQKSFKKFESNYLTQIENIKTSISSHLKELAYQEVSQISNATNKLHVVESEVLTHLFKLKKDLKKGSLQTKTKAKLNQSKYDLIFPLGKESWLDEVSNHKAVTKKCKFNSKESI